MQKSYISTSTGHTSSDRERPYYAGGTINEVEKRIDKCFLMPSVFSVCRFRLLGLSCRPWSTRKITFHAAIFVCHSTIGDRVFPVAHMEQSAVYSVTSSTSPTAFMRRLKSELFINCRTDSDLWRRFYVFRCRALHLHLDLRLLFKTIHNLHNNRPIRLFLVWVVCSCFLCSRFYLSSVCCVVLYCIVCVVCYGPSCLK